MEDTIFLLILAIAEAVVVFLLARYGFSKYSDTAKLVFKALEDKKVTTEEIEEIVNQFKTDLKE